MQLFDKVRSDNPAALSKVVPILGDITEPGLGIGETDLELLKENVSIVFHLAATIKFDAPIRWGWPVTFTLYGCACVR